MRCLAICQIICSFFWMAPFAEGAVPNRDKPPGFSDGKPDYYEEIYDRTILGKSPAQIFSAINNGWGKNLASLRSALNPDASYLILHLQEPVDNYDFRSADQFRNSLMAKGITKMAQNTFGVGHFFLSWRCQKKEMFEGTVGMTGELDNQFRKALDLGWGLSAFWAIFEDGHLQTPELLDYEFEDSGNIHTLAIEVEPEVCGRAIAFVKSFLFHPNKP